MKYTAIDILLLAGVETPGDKIGKVSVSIGGVVVNDPQKVVNVQDAETVECSVGGKTFTAKLPKEQTDVQKKSVEDVKKAKGEASTADRIAKEKVQDVSVEA